MPSVNFNPSKVVSGAVTQLAETAELSRRCKTSTSDERRPASNSGCTSSGCTKNQHIYTVCLRMMMRRRRRSSIKYIVGQHNKAISSVS
jgi:hypothetical protein